MSRRRVLVLRLDNNGDVILAGPAIRAVAASGAVVTLVCGPRGEPAARILPEVDRVLVLEVPWIDPQPSPTTPELITAAVARLREEAADAAVILTSFHQSALPTALLLRMAGCARVSAVSDDYAGSLLDDRVRVPAAIHEVERSLRVVGAAGYQLAEGDDDSLRVLPLSGARVLSADPGYVVVHPGCTAPARTLSPDRWQMMVGRLSAAGHRVVVTGSPQEAALTAHVAQASALDLGGKTDLGELASVIGDASVVVCGNTVAAHLAAAMVTPVVSVYAPTVPAIRWHPWRVTHRLLGEQQIVCAGCRATVCPVPGHPCVGSVTADDIVAAVASLQSRKPQGAAELSLTAVVR